MSDPRITRQAEADLEEVWRYLGFKNEAAADRLLAKILKQCQRLARFPKIGRQRDDLAPGLRSFVVKPYVIFFRPADETVEIIRILHGARDIEAIIPDDQE